MRGRGRVALGLLLCGVALALAVFARWPAPEQPRALELEPEPTHVEAAEAAEADDAAQLTTAHLEDAAADAPSGPTLQVLGPAGGQVQAQLEVGAPGLYPAQSLKTDGQGRVALPALSEGLDGAPGSAYTVIARALWGEPLGFWGAPTRQGQESSSAPAQTQVTLKLEAAAALRVRVTTSAGQPLPGATLSLARDAIHVVRLTARADSAGRAAWPAIVPGRYMLRVRAPGWLQHEVWINHTLDESAPPHTISPQPWREVYGCVERESGVPTGVVSVSALIDPVGAPGAVPLARLRRVDGPPEAASTWSDLDGCFWLGGLPGGVAYLVASDAGGQLGFSAPLDLREALEVGPVTVRLARGEPLRVRVIDAEGQPVRAASVRWEDDARGGSGQLLTDPQGVAAFSHVPAGARLIATLGARFRSEALDLFDTSAAQAREVTLTLRRLDQSPSWTLRLAPRPPEVTILSVHVAAASGRDAAISCEALSEDGRDWRFEACQQGLLWLQVSTREHGIWARELQVRGDLTVAMPPPLPITLEIEPATSQQLIDAALRVRFEGESGWRAVTLSPPVRGEEVALWRWRAQAYEGPLALALRLADGQTQSRALEVREGMGPARWRLTQRAPLTLFVADRRGRPAHDAWVALYDASGALVDEALSEGRAGATFAVSLPFQGRAVAFSAQEGEGALALSLTQVRPDVQQIITLDQAPLSVSAPARVRERARLEALLGAALVEDRDGLLIDVIDPDSRAARAQIPRGAQLLHATQAGESGAVVYMHRGAVRRVVLP